MTESMIPENAPLPWPSLYRVAAAALGGRITWLDGSGYAGRIDFEVGPPCFFHGGMPSLNGSAQSRIAKDKAFTRNYLHSLGIPVPVEEILFSADTPAPYRTGREAADAPRWAAQLGYPLYVKPVHLQQGLGVRRVADKSALAEAVSAVLALDTAILLQRPCAGQDVRILVLDGRVEMAYLRSPLRLVGDGERPLRALLEARFQESHFAVHKRPALVAEALDRLGLPESHILAANSAVVLQDVANLSLGGEATDILDRLDPRFAALAIRVAEAMDLRYAGVDLIAEDPSDAEQPYVVLEVNASPGVRHMLGQTGAEDALVAFYTTLLRAVRDGPPNRRP
ncbi:MAG: hypothetical protein ACPGOY_06585 [Rhodospirillaceae bacterium]